MNETVASITNRLRDLTMDTKVAIQGRELVRRHIAELVFKTLRFPTSLRIAQDLQVARSTYRELDDRVGTLYQRIEKMTWKLERAKSMK